MSFRITGLDPKPFRHLFGLSDDELREKGAVRYVAGEKPGFPCRVELRDAELGKNVLLLNYTHQPAATPYRASHAIFVREGAQTPCDIIDEVPEAMRVRPISLRAFDAHDMMIHGDLMDGAKAERGITEMLGDPRVAYIHAHYARRGCYAARIDRV